MFDGLFLNGFGLRLRHVKLMLLGWLLAEVLLFILVVRMLGFGGAVLLGIATSVVGIATLRRLGASAVNLLRGNVAGSGGSEGAVPDGLLAALGAFLLIVPGFVSDLAGLALATPSVRHRILARLGSRGPAGPKVVRRRTDGVVDLTPNEWSVVDRPGR
jgi:UPF0716 protein FxsA